MVDRDGQLPLLVKPRTERIETGCGSCLLHGHYYQNQNEERPGFPIDGDCLLACQQKGLSAW